MQRGHWQSRCYRQSFATDKRRPAPAGPTWRSFILSLRKGRRRPDIPLLVVAGRGTADGLAGLPVDLSGLSNQPAPAGQHSLVGQDLLNRVRTPRRLRQFGGQRIGRNGSLWHEPNANRAGRNGPTGCGNREGRFCRRFTGVVFDSRAAIVLIVRFVAIGIKSLAFLARRMAESKKLIHIICSSISITDIGVGARCHPCLWNRE
jgi:hypothetical protein